MSGGEHRALTREAAAELVAEMLGLPVFSGGLITARCLSRLCVPRSVLLPMVAFIRHIRNYSAIGLTSGLEVICR